MYTAIGGSLTPTAPVYGDMRTDLTLNVTSDIPATVEGGEERKSTQLPQDDERGSMTDVATPFTEVPEKRPKVIQERSSQEELPGRIEVTRESSGEDALATTRLFFNTVAERRNMNEVLTTTTRSVSQTDTPPVLSVPVVAEPAELETTSTRTFLPNGSPPRPTATATCRPWTWVQHISEGQIEEHSGEDDHSVGSVPLEPLVLEGLPDELGPKWRVLHPFEILGVRFPTEDTPPTHRRLAENDALVELIQTHEYLEDAPSWGQRRFYPPQYGDPYYRGRGRGHGRGRGRGRGWLSEDVERDISGVQGRTSFHGNGRGQSMLQRNMD